MKITPAFVATGRQDSLFLADLTAHHAQLEAQLNERRVLVIGGAGTIGSATIHELAKFSLAALHVVDQNENGLAELVRDIRSRGDGLYAHEFRVFPIDFGSAVMHRLLASQQPYDIVLNFAALKHVRSEKDAVSVLQMVDTNVLKPLGLLDTLRVGPSGLRYFCVSTDKAANPVNLMGASKRLMEMVLFARAFGGLKVEITSARFANVAFSNGSLLESFALRMRKGQPLAVPEHTKRFFVSVEESGQICLLAAMLAPTRHLLIPRLNAAEHLVELESVARAVLEHAGLRPRIYRDEASAKAAVERDLSNHEYPLLLTPLDTSGEKAYEEFVGEKETVKEVGMEQLLAVSPTGPNERALFALVDELSGLAHDPALPVTKERLVELIQGVVPEFHHRETGRSLDQRM